MKGEPSVFLRFALESCAIKRRWSCACHTRGHLGLGTQHPLHDPLTLALSLSSSPCVHGCRPGLGVLVVSGLAHGGL